VTSCVPDVASAEQQKPAAPQQDQDPDREEDDIAMDTEEQEEQLKASEDQELKPEKLDSTRTSKKGVASSPPPSVAACLGRSGGQEEVVWQPEGCWFDSQDPPV